MSRYTSIKWISANETEFGRKLVVHDISKSIVGVPATTFMDRRQRGTPINLISIFGRARQGKSFLMNCLAGETDIFKISNEKESCTQGIDLSTKWLTLRQFSSIDSGVGRDGPSAIGFIDAEGQGDRDVSYDAKLVCPILLASKCVLFNWKGDLQKDHLLSTLGVMARAAANVVTESNQSDRSNKKFGHLHIIFRDWQAVSSTGSNNGIGSSRSDPNANAVFNDLFAEEKQSSDTAGRNQIRRDILAAFETVDVWLFDSPTETTAALRQKLTYSATTNTFKAQVRALRAMLSEQLLEPTIAATTILSTSNLSHLVSSIADTLNNGQVVLPSNAYVNMMQQELHMLTQKLEEKVVTMTSDVIDALMKEYTKSQQSLVAYQKNYGKNPIQGCNYTKEAVTSGESGVGVEMALQSFPKENDAMNSFTQHVDKIVEEIQKEIALVFGENNNSNSNPLIIQLQQNLPNTIQSIKKRATDHFLSSYKQLLLQYIVIAREASERVVTMTVEAMLRCTKPSSSIQQDMNSVYALALAILGYDKYSDSLVAKDAMNSAVESVKSILSSASKNIEQMNMALIQQEEQHAQTILSKCCNHMAMLLDNYFQDKESGISCGNLSPLSIEEVENFFNTQFLQLKTSIMNENMSPQVNRTTIIKFTEYCMELNKKMLEMHQRLIAIAFSNIVERHKPDLKTAFEEAQEIEVEDEDEFTNNLHELRADIINAALYEAADWNQSPELEGQLIETPLEQYAESMINKLLSDYRIAYATARSKGVTEEDDMEENEEDLSSSSTSNIDKKTASKSSVLNKKEQQEKARLYAISQGWIKDTKAKKSKSTASSTASKAISSKKKKGLQTVTSKTREDVEMARQKAREWAAKTLGQYKLTGIDENIPWYRNQHTSSQSSSSSAAATAAPPTFKSSVKAMDGKDKLAQVKAEAAREMEERTKRALEAIAESSSKKPKK